MKHSRSTGVYVIPQCTRCVWNGTNLFAGPETSRLNNGRLQMPNSVRMVDQSRVHQLLVILLVEELATDHEPHARHHVVLNQTSNWRAILRNQILEVSAGCIHKR